MPAARVTPSAPVVIPPAPAAASDGDRSPTEDVILDAARSCFARTGVARTAVSHIAAEAGVSRTTLYRYFTGRDAVAAALLDREVNRFRADLAAAAAGAKQVEDLMLATGTLGQGIWGDGVIPEIHLHLEGQATGHPAFPRFAVDVPAQIIAPHLARLTGITASDARLVADWIVRLGMSYLLVPAPELMGTDPRSTRRILRRFLLPLVHGHGTPAPSNGRRRR